MSRLRRLPAQVDPAPGEALTSLVRRTAAVNDIAPFHIWTAAGIDGAWMLARTTRAPTPAQLDALSALLGPQPRELADMTVFRYRHSVIARPRGRGGWRVDLHDWSCPQCTTDTGITRRDWALALCPVCTDCHTVLQPGADLDGGIETLPADDPGLALQEQLLTWLHRSVDNDRANRILRQLLRLAELVSSAADADWPPPYSDEDLARRQAAITTNALVWRDHPPRSPAAVLTLLVPCMRAVDSIHGIDRLTRHAWSRLASEPDRVPAERFLTTEHYLPAGANAETLFQAGRARAGQRPDWRELDRAIRAIAALRRLGLQARHVPALCREADGTFLPPAPELVRRHELAVVLLMILNASSDSQLGNPQDAWIDLHLHRPVGAALAQSVHRRLEITPAYSDVVVDFAERLVSGGLVDYRKRRAALQDMIRVSFPKSTRSAPEEAARRDRLAAEWIWVQFTRGAPRQRLRARTDIRQVIVFDATLTPAERSHLEAHARESIAGSMAPVNPSPR